MAFQTSFLRDGEWVTETVTVESALRQATAAASDPSSERRPEPPSCGILSRTIVESPIVHRVLPVRLRSKRHNDIAFVGRSPYLARPRGSQSTGADRRLQERFVQISELRRDGQVHEVARKSDLGSRIRSAAVLGDPLEHGLDDETPGGVDSDASDSSMPDAPDSPYGTQPRTLPPQLLVLMLDSTDTVFLFLREQPDASLEFVLVRYSMPKYIPHLGHHLAIDPSSRYMAAASPDGVLVMFELEEMAVLGAQYMSRASLAPVKSVRPRAIQGVIHKLDFLCPRPEDDYHIVLIMIVIRRERSPGEPITRMITYEWEWGDSLKDTFAEAKSGNRLPREHKMPLLLIPLRFSTAFFTVSDKSIGIVKNCLSGAPVFESLCTQAPNPTKLHHGADNPLWTSWARPFRRKKYFDRTDIIYLAREDGAIIHIEIEATDLVPSVTNVGCLDANIDTAFATAYDIFSVILIIGGDSGPGGIWKLAPRTDLEQVSILPNWSPVVDVATTTRCSVRNAASTGSRAAGARRAMSNNSLAKPDSVFTASGRGPKGSATEWRWGIQGRIGLDIECGQPIRRSWELALGNPEGGGDRYALLALPHSSVVLRFSDDFSRVDALTAQETHLDIASPTLDACRTPQGMIVQVTERSVVVVTESDSLRCSLEEILATESIAAGSACCADDTVIVSTHGDQGSRLHTLLATQAGIHHNSTWEVRGEVTCVSLFAGPQSNFVIAGSVLDGTPWISIYSSSGETVASKALAEHHEVTGTEAGEAGAQFEPLTSICLVHKDTDTAHFAAGTRCGHLLGITFTGRGAEQVSWAVETIGVAPVEVFPASSPFNGTAAVLMCCDNKLIVMTEFSPQSARFQRKHFVWLTDAKDVSMPSPPVHSVCSWRHNISGYAGHMSLMVQAGSRLLLAEMLPHVGPVPRNIPLEGTPTRIVYSQTWNCLVVALLKGDKPTLAFIEPESGETLSVPSDKDMNPCEFISGLGHPGDRIYGLHEWLYVKDGKTFSFILVATKDGQLLIVSVHLDKSKSREKEGRAKRLLYWTRYKRILGQPVYSVVGDDEGIIFCADKRIHWEVLDSAQKRLRPMKVYELDSPATSLRVVRGTIFALTTLHSLEVIDYRSRGKGDMVLIHSDPVSRRTVHMMDAGDAADGQGQWPVTLLSDQRGGIAGIWVPWGQCNKEFEVMFEGVLPTSVRRFAGTHSRPLWLADGRRPRYGTLPGTESGADILGVALDGSLQHLTLIGVELWRFLRLIQNMARRRPEASPLADTAALGREEGVDDDDDDDKAHRHLPRHSRRMHIDGDVLERCFRQRALEKMVQKGDGFSLFCEYLDQLEGGRYTQSFRDAAEPEQDRGAKYLRLGYDILQYLLDDVM